MHYFDSLGFLYFDIAKLIDEDDQGNKVNIIDTYKIAPYKQAKYIFKCNSCGNKSRKRLDSVTSRGYSCNMCDDGKSFGEKFIFYLLKLNNINFINQLSKHNFTWCDKYRYDFYLPEYNIIIDTEGYYHYTDIINDIDKQTNDMKLAKEKLAIDNGIFYKKINYNFNNKRSIEKNTIKALKEIIDFDNIDFEEIYKLSNESLVFKVCDQWNEGKSTIEISNELCLARATIIKYLKKGNELGIVNYDSKLEMKYNAINTNKNKRKKIICKTTGEVFNSQLEAADKYNISTASIISCCRGKRSYGGRNDRGERLVWGYY